MNYVTTKTCFGCESTKLNTILSLGQTPLADRLLSKHDLAQTEPFVPLGLVHCNDCSLVQLAQTVAPDQLFGPDYPYFSSVSPALRDHFGKSALALIEQLDLSNKDLVVEVASNDGVMLRHFAERGVRVLGIDPSDGPAQVARDKGVPTLTEYFGRDLAQRLRDEDGHEARLILANNVLAHVPDLQGFVSGMATLLADDGMAVVEAPYLLDLIDGTEFDTIYHQHICYFSVTALDILFRRHGLFLNHVEPLKIHGGSLRLFIEKKDNPGDSVSLHLRREANRNVKDPSCYDNFVARAERLRSDLPALLRDLKAAGKSIAAYGAAAKGTTLLAACGLDHSTLDYVVDLNPHKQGLYMSGARLPIEAPEALQDRQPDYLLVLAWNFADEIMAQQEQYRHSGGQFIIPIPEIRIV